MRGPGNYISSQREKQAWSDVATSLTTALPGDVLFNPRSLGEGSQRRNLQLKGCWWFSLELKKSRSRCGRPLANHSRSHIDPQPAWYSSVAATMASQRPGRLVHYHEASKPQHGNASIMTKGNSHNCCLSGAEVGSHWSDVRPCCCSGPHTPCGLLEPWITDHLNWAAGSQYPTRLVAQSSSNDCCMKGKKNYSTRKDRVMMADERRAYITTWSQNKRPEKRQH